MVLGIVGANPPEGNFILVGRLATTYYFLHFLVILPVVGWLESPKPLPDSIASPVLGEKATGHHAKDLAGLPSSELAQLIQDLTDQMREAAAELQFELAARLRDEVEELKKELRQMMEATK